MSNSAFPCYPCNRGDFPFLGKDAFGRRGFAETRAEKLTGVASSGMLSSLFWVRAITRICKAPECRKAW